MLKRVESDASFLFRFVLGTFLVLALVGLLNFYVDPQAFFGHRRFPPLTVNNSDRNLKVRLIQQMPSEKLDFVIFGSSRVLKVDPKDIFDLNHRSGFNAGVGGASVLDLIAFSGLIDLKNSIKYPDVIWGLDVEMLVDSPPSGALITNHLLREHLSARDFLKSIFPKYAEFLSLSMLLQSLELLYRVQANQIRWRPESYSGKFSDLGFRILDGHDRDLKKNPDIADRIRSSTKKIISKRYYDPQRMTLGTDRKRQVADLLSFWNKNNVTPVIYIPPTHSDAAAKIGPLGWSELKAQVMDFFQTLEADYSFKLFDFSSVEKFNGLEDGFYDAIHPTKENNRKLLEMLRSKGAI